MTIPVFAEPLSDRTGLTTDFSIQSGSETFVVESTANFDVKSVSLEGDKLVFAINSNLANNLGEIQIPNGLAQGELRFFLDGQQIIPKVLHNDKISFVTLEFTGNGTHTLEIQSDHIQKTETVETTDDATEENSDVLIISAVIGIVVAGGAGTTAAVYFKRKKV
jgi:uncharacterized membrane protein YvbJ